MHQKELIKIAKNLVGEFELAKPEFVAGSVGSALLTSSGNIYTGICFDLACGIGICAEQSAVAEMLKNRETKIEMLVAVTSSTIMPPCGKCRELLIQIDEENTKTKIFISDYEYLSLDKLLPVRWK
ncbi:cytidine deaminase [Lentisphaerota bacterium ZTH]|nr:cytidine deaminase [Lentisphaerota bacterium]WET06949.1 cytidine deaminase [Lentisphaerota bacterium ZTH]